MRCEKCGKQLTGQIEMSIGTCADCRGALNKFGGSSAKKPSAPIFKTRFY